MLKKSIIHNTVKAGYYNETKKHQNYCQHSLTNISLSVSNTSFQQTTHYKGKKLHTKMPETFALLTIIWAQFTLLCMQQATKVHMNKLKRFF
jgi:hypothetical protein